jgi:micrococcal nuclease
MRYIIILFGLLAISCAEVSEAKVITGKVIKVADGDTFTLLTADTQKVKVRLLDIDCPENGQPHGKGAKQLLSELIFGKEVYVKYDKKDRYGRVLGKVYVGDVFVNMTLIESGYAWHFKKYSKNENFAKAEQTARIRKVGLWQDKFPIAPWDWRKGKKN